jgi:hypothetical protein
MWPLFLDGAASPIGCGISFIDRPVDVVQEAVLAVRACAPVPCEVLAARPLPDCLDDLDPMENPWTVDLVVDCGDWTAYLNNGLDGGDITAIAPAVARQLEARCVVAQHIGPYGPGHAATQLWLMGPDGVPPLMHVRTLSAHAEDGRWSWYERGTPQGWEATERYTARSKRQRLDRDLLVRYLGQFDIRIDDPEFFGTGTAFRQQVTWPTRRVSVAEWRRERAGP